MPQEEEKEAEATPIAEATNWTKWGGIVATQAVRPIRLDKNSLTNWVFTICAEMYGSGAVIGKAVIVTDQTNPQGSSTGSGRVLRGGSWYDSDIRCRVADLRWTKF